jgi:Leucine-rich repeat (LRR) protein
MKKLTIPITMLLALGLMCGPASATLFADNDFDGKDLAILVAAYDSATGSSSYNPDCDFNFDGWVDEADLSSFSSNFGKTDLVIDFPDLNLEFAVREAINKPGLDDIMFSDLQGLANLSAQSKGIIALGGLQYCLNLDTLSLSYNQISDISPLAGLVNLNYLYMSDNQISDLSPLTGLVNLIVLRLSDNLINDVGPLSALDNLSELNLITNQISDLSPLSGLTNLVWLRLSGNQITDVGPLFALVNLSELNLSANQIIDISALADLDALSLLTLTSNDIIDISALAGLVNLGTLDLNDNLIEDIFPLVSNPGIDSGDFVYVQGNSLDPDSCAIHIPNLMSRGVIVAHDCL